MEYCKYLLDQAAGVPFCLNDQNTNLGLAGTWIPLPASIKMLFGRLKGLLSVGVVQDAFQEMKV